MVFLIIGLINSIVIAILSLNKFYNNPHIISAIGWGTVALLVLITLVTRMRND